MAQVIAFRADASLQIGIGHVMRCLTLADALATSGADCQFLCRAHEGNLIEFIRGRGYVAHALPIGYEKSAGSIVTRPEAFTTQLAHSHWLGATQTQDAKACASILAAQRPDWLIVDHYAIDARWERALAPHYLKLMVIDDLADRSHACDLLLDQTFGRNAADYRPLVPADCHLLCGSQYALLRPEFAALRPHSLQRRARPALRELLITMGGVDKGNATGQVLHALRTCPLPVDCRITVVMGATAPWLEEVSTRAKDMPWTTRVLVGVRDMAKLMAESDLAIGAAGSTSWELCCLGVPNLLVCTAENQRTVSTALAAVGATVKLDSAALNEPDGVSFLVQCAVLTENLKSYATAAARITDGSGASRVYAELIRLL